MSRGQILIVSLCAALALAVAGCGSSGDDSSSTRRRAKRRPRKSDAGAHELEREAEGDGSRAEPPPKKLEEKEIVEGDGAEAKSGDEVTVQYVGVGYDSKEEFDSSWSRSEPFTFTLGAGEVITGWDQGIAGMKVGGRRELIIPAEPRLRPGRLAAGDRRRTKR